MKIRAEAKSRLQAFTMGYHRCQMDAKTLVAVFHDKSAILIPVSAFAAYFGGVLTDPLKKRFTVRDDRKRLRNGLYAEMANNISNMSSYLVFNHQLLSNQVAIPATPRQRLGKFPEVRKWSRTEVFDEALKQPILFRSIKEACFISDFYLALNVLKDKDLAQQPEAIHDIQQWVANCVRGHQLSRRKLNRYIPKPDKHEHPVFCWLNRKYNDISCRNVPKQGSRAYGPSNGIFAKTKALFRGLPGKSLSDNTMTNPDAFFFFKRE